MCIHRTTHMHVWPVSACVAYPTRAGSPLGTIVYKLNPFAHFLGELFETCTKSLSDRRLMSTLSRTFSLFLFFSLGFLDPFLTKSSHILVKVHFKRYKPLDSSCHFT